MGLLDALFQSSEADRYGGYGGQGGGLLDLIRSSQAQNDQYQPAAGFQPQQPPASFADRFAAMPGAPPQFAPQPRPLDQAQFDPSTFAPNQAQPINVGKYQMPRMGSADQFTPPPQMAAALPQNAQPTQGQLPAAPSTDISAQSRQPQALPSFLGGQDGSAGIGDRLSAGVNNFANAGGPLQALAGGIGGLFNGQRTDAQGIQQQNLRAQFQSIQQALIQNGETPQAASSKAMVAVMNPEAAKTILPELFTNKTELKMVKDQFGGEVPYSWNAREQTLKRIGSEGETAGAGSVGGSSGGYLNKGVAEYDPSLPGKAYLEQFSPDVQSAIMAYKRGDSMPTGNARKGWAENVQKFAKAYGDKIGEPVSDQTFFEKKKLKTDLGSSSNSSMGGILDNGESSFAHLAELGKSFADLGSISHNFPGGGYLAQGQNAIGSAFGGSDTKGKIVSAKQNLTKYGQESTKFYAGTGGGVEERTAALRTVPPESSSGEEQASYMEKEKQLMLDRLNNKFDHIRQTLGEEEGNKIIAKKMPTISQNIATIDASISKLRGTKADAPSGSLPSGWSVKVR